MLQSMALQRVRDDWVTEQQLRKEKLKRPWLCICFATSSISKSPSQGKAGSKSNREKVLGMNDSDNYTSHMHENG